MVVEMYQDMCSTNQIARQFEDIEMEENNVKSKDKKNFKKEISYPIIMVTMIVFVCIMTACGDGYATKQSDNNDETGWEFGEWWDSLIKPKSGGTGSGSSSGSDLVRYIGEDLESTLEELNAENSQFSQLCTLHDKNGDELIDSIEILDEKYTLAGLSVGMTREEAYSHMKGKYTEVTDSQLSELGYSDEEGLNVYMDSSGGNMIMLLFDEDDGENSQEVVGVGFYSSEAINAPLDE